MDSGIYIIKNVNNKKIYVGQTINLTVRYNNHLYLLRKNKHRNKHLQASFNKYGEKCFKFIILEKTERLNEREIFWIDILGGINSSLNYNQSSGGYGGGKRSDLVKQAISKRQNGRKLTKTHCNNISKSNIGKKKHNTDHKKYISYLFKGRLLSNETKIKISKSLKGRKLSDITKLKLKEKKAKPVVQYDLQGNFIQEFESAKIAGNILSFWKSDITQCCKGNRKTVKSFIFKYKGINNESNN